MIRASLDLDKFQLKIILLQQKNLPKLYML